jgi:cytochrome c-type biogenesis protein CcmH
MALWFVFALMTAAAVFAVLWPLGRGPRVTASGSETIVYTDQLAEIDRDLAAGMIPKPDAEAARVEISRRLLAAADGTRATPSHVSMTLRRVVSIVALIGVPALAAALYLPLGSPRMPDFPLADRRGLPSANDPLDRLVAQVEGHLETNPTDGRGWTVLAPVLVKLERYDDAVRAYRNSITYAGETAERRADLGEAITGVANGVVTSDAKTEFERAVTLDSENPKAAYFLGLAAEQDGRGTEAAKIWRALLEKASPDAPWRSAVQQALARVGGVVMPAPSQEAVTAASGMNDTDRNAMIRGMVDGLATKLKADGSDVEGWLRLMRAYMVLGDRALAKRAEIDARAALSDNAERLKQLDDGVKSLGLNG